MTGISEEYSTTCQKRDSSTSGSWPRQPEVRCTTSTCAIETQRGSRGLTEPIMKTLWPKQEEVNEAKDDEERRERYRDND